MSDIHIIGRICGEGTQYEIAYAKFLGKRVDIWKGDHK